MSYCGPDGSYYECERCYNCEEDNFLSDHDSIFEEVKAELSKSIDKFGVQDHSAFKWLAIIGEEYGESCQAAIQAYAEPGKKTWVDYRKELVQTACVAIKAIENFDRRAESKVVDLEAEIRELKAKVKALEEKPSSVVIEKSKTIEDLIKGIKPGTWTHPYFSPWTIKYTTAKPNYSQWTYNSNMFKKVPNDSFY